MHSVYERQIEGACQQFVGAVGKEIVTRLDDHLRLIGQRHKYFWSRIDADCRARRQRQAAAMPHANFKI